MIRNFFILYSYSGFEIRDKAFRIRIFFLKFSLISQSFSPRTWWYIVIWKIYILFLISVCYRVHQPEKTLIFKELLSQLFHCPEIEKMEQLTWNREQFLLLTCTMLGYVGIEPYSGHNNLIKKGCLSMVSSFFDSNNCSGSVLSKNWRLCTVLATIACKNCMLLAASRIQIVSEWPPVACKLNPRGRIEYFKRLKSIRNTKQLLHAKSRQFFASTLPEQLFELKKWRRH